MIKFNLMALRDPRDPAGSFQHFARIIRGDYVGYEDLIRLISKMSSINYGVIQGVLGTLIDVIEEQVRFGRTVQIGNLDTLFMTLSSQSTTKVEDFELSHIKSARLRFLPSPMLKRTLADLKFERADSNGNDNGQTDDANEGKPAPAGVDVTPNEHAG